MHPSAGTVPVPVPVLADPRGAARRAQMLRLQSVWTGYRAGVGCGRQAGKAGLATRLAGGCTQGLVRDVSLKLGFRVFDQPTSET